MKIYLLPLILTLGIVPHLSAQDRPGEKTTDSLQELTGSYQAGIDSSLRFNIKKGNDRLILELPGQGQTDLVALGKDRFRPNQVSPPVTLAFIRDKMGRA